MRKPWLYSLAAVLIAMTSAHGGVVNPNISVIGQPVVGLTDDLDSPDRDRVHLDAGETEFMFEDYLNPYSRGMIILSLAEGEIELEEGYFTIFRGLPAGLSLKAGKYRVGFGKLNAVHPHANPFAERPRVLSTFLPGEESLNETGVSVSKRIPMPGDISLVGSIDWLQGNTFRLSREADDAAANAGDPVDSYATGPDRAGETRPALAFRLDGFVMAGERSGIEIGLSAVDGTNNVAAGTRTRVLGADVKAKLWNSESSYLVLQAELLKLRRENASWNSNDETYESVVVDPVGGYLYADYNFDRRYNIGASFGRYQNDARDEYWNQAVGLFAGFSLMEETTAFRFDWTHDLPGTPQTSASEPPAVNTFLLRLIYSMGPHKAHQF